MDLFSPASSGSGPEWAPSDEMLKAMEANGARMLAARKDHVISTESKVQGALMGVRYAELLILRSFDTEYGAALKEAAALEAGAGIREGLAAIHGKKLADRILEQINMHALLTQRADTYFQTRESYKANAAQITNFLQAPRAISNFTEQVSAQIGLAVRTWKEEVRRFAELDPTLEVNERVLARMARRVDAGEFMEALSGDGYRRALREELPTVELFESAHRKRAELAPRVLKAKGELLGSVIEALEEARISSSEPHFAEMFLASLTWLRDRQATAAESHKRLGAIELKYLGRALYGQM